MIAIAILLLIAAFFIGIVTMVGAGFVMALIFFWILWLVF